MPVPARRPKLPTARRARRNACAAGSRYEGGDVEGGAAAAEGGGVCGNRAGGTIASFTPPHSAKNDRH